MFQFFFLYSYSLIVGCLQSTKLEMHTKCTVGHCKQCIWNIHSMFISISISVTVFLDTYFAAAHIYFLLELGSWAQVVGDLSQTSLFIHHVNIHFPHICLMYMIWFYFYFYFHFIYFWSVCLRSKGNCFFLTRRYSFT